MRSKVIMVLFAAVFSFPQSGPSTIGDVVFPGVLFTDGSSPGVIDVTKPPFNADPSGTRDSTEALINAYETVYAAVSKYHPGQGVPNGKERAQTFWKANYIIYLPVGVYLVRDTIVYRSPLEAAGGWAERFQRLIRFCGQNMEKTIIRLADEAPGFNDTQKPKAVIRFGKTPDGEVNNTVASSYFENITIDTGSGNPGAAGLMFAAANCGAVRDIIIRSTDGRGFCGLYLALSDTQCIYKNILIEGFDHGIVSLGDRAISQSFENITLRGQRIAGIRSGRASQSIRKLLSQNRVPALLLDNDMALSVVVDSSLIGGSPEQAAVVHTEGRALIRNVAVSGYGSGLMRDGKVICVGNIDEYISDDTISPFSSGAAVRSYPLPVKDVPVSSWEKDLSRWIGVHETGAVGDMIADDAIAIQKAVNSGKPVVYFKPGRYLIARTVEIPPSVKTVNFMYSSICASGELVSNDQPLFLSIGESKDPLIVEDCYTWGSAARNHCPYFGQGSKRTMVIRDMFFQQGLAYRNYARDNELFFENVSITKSEYAVPFVFSAGQSVWARWLNSEHTAAGEIRNDGSRLWLFGFKTESAKDHPLIHLVNDSSTEILGGVFNFGTGGPFVDKETPAVLIEDSRTSLSFTVCGPPSYNPKYSPDIFFTRLVSEKRGGQEKHLSRDDVPVRGKTIRSVVPLYLSEKK